MPTGYTFKVQDGTVATVSEYALICARAFGALVMMKDQPNGAPIPKQMEPNVEYFDRGIDRARATLSKLPHMSYAECVAEAAAEHEKALASYNERRAEYALFRARYDSMSMKVKQWEVPEELAELRKYMLSQLSESREFDCSDRYDPPPPDRLSGDAWREAALKRAERDLEYHTKHRDEEIERVADRNRWLSALWDALPKE